MELPAFLQKLCVMMQEFFFASYGDSTTSVMGDISLPASSDWQQISSISTPCIFRLRNMDSADEIMITWDRTKDGGIKVAAGGIEVYDGVSGVIYARVVDPATTAVINVGVIAKRTTE